MRSFTPWKNNGCFTDVASEGECAIDLSVRQEPDPRQILYNYYFKCIFLDAVLYTGMWEWRHSKLNIFMSSVYFPNRSFQIKVICGSQMPHPIWETHQRLGKKIEWVKRGKNFQPKQGKRLVGCWAGSTSSPPALTQHHQPGPSLLCSTEQGSLLQGHPSAPMAALESLVLDTVFPECLKAGLNLTCSNSLAFDTDKPRLITECLIRDCI